MRDCPACRVPLHGYEEFCPSCGTKQQTVRSGSGRMPYGTAFKPEEPKVNVVPFVVAFVIFAGFMLFAINSTWIGQLMREGKHEEDPIAKMSALEARSVLEAELNKNLTAVGAQNSKMTWTASGAGADTGSAVGGAKPDERSVDGPVELTVDTTLSTPDLRKQIVDPVKPYMSQAKVMTLNVNDSKSHAHWTYSVQAPLSTPEPDAE